jgi:hypothetical protein
MNTRLKAILVMVTVLALPALGRAAELALGCGCPFCSR